jgi:carbohydrate-binding DOMON domain-containing protein
MDSPSDSVARYFLEALRNSLAAMETSKTGCFVGRILSEEPAQDFSIIAAVPRKRVSEYASSYGLARL